MMKKITFLAAFLIAAMSYGQIKQIKGKNSDASACVAGGFNAIMYPNGFTGTIQDAYIGESTTTNWEFIANLTANPNGLGNANVFYIAEIIFLNNIPASTANSSIISITSSDFTLTSFAHNATDNTLACSFGATQLNKLRFNLEYTGTFAAVPVTVDITIHDVVEATTETITLTVTPVGATASIEDLQKFNFSYAPNPSKDFVRLSAANNIENVEIFNLLGQKLISKDLNSNNETVDISNFAKGVYLMNVTIDGSKGSFKIIKE